MIIISMVLPPTRITPLREDTNTCLHSWWICSIPTTADLQVVCIPMMQAGVKGYPVYHRLVRAYLNLIRVNEKSLSHF